MTDEDHNTMASLGENRETPFSVNFTHRIRFTNDPFDTSDTTLADLLQPTKPGVSRAMAFVDQGLTRAQPAVPDRIDEVIRRSGQLAAPAHLVIGGEQIKDGMGEVVRLIGVMSRAGLCRRSTAVVIGGGAVLDAVGFAAALTHRGIRIVRLPSTTLAQADAGVAVKCGVNLAGSKNLAGAFAPPEGIVIADSLLNSLSDRDWRSGFAEAIKVAVLKDADLFELIECSTTDLANRSMTVARPIIARSALLHADHITLGGDPFERTNARPLDFGHWAAHRLEEMTHHRLRHGEAVAIGIAIDTMYAAEVGLCSSTIAERIIASLVSLGFELHDPAMDNIDALLIGLDRFREHLGGELTITLPTAIGRSTEVHEIDHDAMAECIRALATHAGERSRTLTT